MPIGKGLYLDIALSCCDAEFCRKWKVKQVVMHERIKTRSIAGLPKGLAALDKILWFVAKVAVEVNPALRHEKVYNWLAYGDFTIQRKAT